MRTDELVERIESRINDAPMPTEHLLDEAAAEIRRLSGELAAAGRNVYELQSSLGRACLALRPFAAAADECEGASEDMTIGDASYEQVTVAHCRKARATLAEMGEG